MYMAAILHVGSMPKYKPSSYRNNSLEAQSVKNLGYDMTGRVIKILFPADRSNFYLL
jgi:hypothetical protein